MDPDRLDGGRKTYEPGGRWCKVLLALAIISTVAAVISSLSAFVGILPQRRTKPQTVVIVVNDIKALAAEPQPDRLIEEESAA